MFLTSLLSAPAFADVTYLVPGNRDGRDACEAAAEAAGDGVQCMRHLTKAFGAAAETMSAGGSMKVLIKLATGEHKGDMDGGNYTLPQFNNAEADLVIEGGWSADFSARDPWGTPSKFVTTPERGGAFWVVGRDTKTRSLVVDGTVWDMAASNKYDARTNSLLKSSSKTSKFIKFNYWELNKLEFKNNVFMNSAHIVTENLIRAATDDAVIRYENNVFINNVIPIKLDTARFRHKPKVILIKNNSFLLNWAYNPDPNTGNPGAVNVGSRDAAHAIVFDGNLFYANFGGAIQIAPDNAPEVSISNNNFVGNGLLHGNAGSSAGAIISARIAGLQPLDLDYMEDITDMTDGDGRGNVSKNPGVAVRLASSTQAVDSDQVRVQDTWENSVRGILGQNLDGGTVAIKDYAPMQAYNPDGWFASAEGTTQYGASREIVE